jgi:hypothetical protein
MENFKWQLELNDFFTSKEINNRSEQNKILKDSITIWLNYIKDKSTLVTSRRTYDGKEEIIVQNSHIFIDDLEISISIDSDNKYLITHSNGSYIKKEDRIDFKFTKREPIQIKVDFDMQLLFEKLTQILIHYK